MPRVRWGSVAVVVCAVALGGCGTSGKAAGTPQMTRAQADALVAQLERARVTAAARDLTGTKAALAGFRGGVARLRRAGAISSATAKALRTGAIRALQRATSDSAPPPVQAPVQTTPAPVQPAPPGKQKHFGKKDGKHGGDGNQGEGGD
jgi:hypothetical protein